MLKKTALDSLTKTFSSHQVATDPAALITYEVDAGFDRAQPDGVFYPDSIEDVSRIMHWASEHGVPLIARGAGTGLAGGAVAEQGGIIIEFARLNRISDVNAIGRSVSAGAGAVNGVLDATVKQHGFYYPPDPSSGRSSTIGGNLGTNAGGPHCFKYGVTTNYVVGLEAVLADGSMVRFGGRALDYPEYDLLALLTGSEGTLAIMVNAHLRLIRNPPGVKTMMVSFQSEAQAGRAVSAVIAAGLTPATLELMDQRSMRMIEQFVEANLRVDAGAALIVEVDGFVEGLDAQMEEVADLLSENGGHDIRFAQTEAERARIWYGRKSAAGAFSRLAPNFYLTDVTVPRSKLGDVLAEITRICANYNVQTANFFHAGDGNLHPLILCDVRDAELMMRVRKAGKEIIQLCIDHDGSITGEHGVGMEKRAYMDAMYSPAELSVMWDIKETFDPHDLLNPGKVLPPKVEWETRQPAQPLTERVLVPSSPEEAAAMLRHCQQAGQPVRIGSDSTNDAEVVELLTMGMSDVIDFAPDDLYVTVGAGMLLSTLQEFLGKHGVQVPMASPFGDTVGSVLATNTNAPLRMRYGPLRDNMLCATVALPDGRVIRAGRPVVKNVAGYDLPKLFVGSFGTLGMLCDVTLKLVPLPRARRTQCVIVDNVAAGVAAANALAPHMLVASAVLVQQEDDDSATLIYTAEGLPEEVAAELAEVRATLGGRGEMSALIKETFPKKHGIEAWRHFWGHAPAEALMLRIGVPPETVGAYLQMLAPAALAQTRLLVDCPAGQIYVAAQCENVEAATALLAQLREPAQALGGYTVVVELPIGRADADDFETLDKWGHTPDSLALMRQLKESFDPHGILNRGHFIV